MRILVLPLAASLVLGACQPAHAQGFDVLRFFAGQTHGDGRLKVAMRSGRTVTVEGRGRLTDPNTLVLDQIVTEEGKASRERRWRIHQDSPGQYSGTLTDAVGPVTASVEDGELHIQFAMKGNLSVDQWLRLAPDGRSAANRMKVKKFGFPVADLEETITKVD